MKVSKECCDLICVAFRTCCILLSLVFDCQTIFCQFFLPERMTLYNVLCSLLKYYLWVIRETFSKDFLQWLEKKNFSWFFSFWHPVLFRSKRQCGRAWLRMQCQHTLIVLSSHRSSKLHLGHHFTNILSSWRYVSHLIFPVKYFFAFPQTFFFLS